LYQFAIHLTKPGAPDLTVYSPGIGYGTMDQAADTASDMVTLLDSHEPGATATVAITEVKVLPGQADTEVR